VTQRIPSLALVGWLLESCIRREAPETAAEPDRRAGIKGLRRKTGIEKCNFRRGLAVFKVFKPHFKCDHASSQERVAKIFVGGGVFFGCLMILALWGRGWRKSVPVENRTAKVQNQIRRRKCRICSLSCCNCLMMSGWWNSSSGIGKAWLCGGSIRAIHSDRSAQHRLAAGIRAYQKMIPLDGIVALCQASIHRPEKTRNRHSDEIFSRSCEITAQGSSCPAYETAVRINQKTVQKSVVSQSSSSAPSASTAPYGFNLFSATDHSSPPPLQIFAIFPRPYFISAFQLLPHDPRLNPAHRLSAFAEMLAGESVGFVLVEVVLIDEIQDEFFPLFGTAPVVAGGGGGVAVGCLIFYDLWG